MYLDIENSFTQPELTSIFHTDISFYMLSGSFLFMEWWCAVRIYINKVHLKWSVHFAHLIHILSFLIQNSTWNCIYMYNKPKCKWVKYFAYHKIIPSIISITHSLCIWRANEQEGKTRINKRKYRMRIVSLLNHLKWS